ncbi:tRNA adenosine(34) deaminase TadA [Desulfatibacillum aliphaticivorans]|uniref:tRNA adenosine(34) deaminase TadA n=1 Tax=Desulfatibacillum aliphaticivorans TaxID=218208 RepID=UPI00041D9206|nr:tRNA adenosine(34) deaminase TadA [Desulfatibacillum aliphaticivorans]
MEKHSKYMQMALDEAKTAWDEDEVPVGAVLVLPDQDLIIKAHNRTIGLNDAAAHGEILALREAGRVIGNYRLLNSVLYCTVEPCIMCMGAVIHARVSKVVFGAPDPKWGACGSLYDFASDPGLNHHPEIVSGVCEEACRTIMQEFFRLKRQGAKSG